MNIRGVQRIVLAVLSVLLVLSAFPVIALGMGQEPSRLKEELPLYSLEKSVNLLLPNKYSVKVEVIKNLQSPKTHTLLFILETSQYDWNNGRTQEHIKLIKEIATVFFSHENTEIGLITVDAKAVLQGYFTKGTESDLVQLLEGLIPEKGNYLEEAITLAQRELAALPTDTPLILLTGGRATYSSRVSRLKINVICTPEHSAQQWSLIPEYKQPKERIGDGNWDTVPSSSALPIPSQTCQLGGVHNYPLNQYPQYHSDTSIFLVSQLENPVVAVGVKATGASLETLKKLGKEAYFSQYTEGKEWLLEHLLPAPPEKVEGLLSETIPPYIRLVQDSLQSSAGTTSYKDGKLQWVVEEGGTLEYEVDLLVQEPGFMENTPYALGMEGVFSYEENQQEKRLEYTQPMGQGCYSQIFIQGVLVDSEGRLLNEQGKVVAQEQDAYGVTEKQGILNPQGVNQWSLNQRVIVGIDSLTLPQEYELFNPALTQQQVDLANEPQLAVVYFHFQKKPRYFSYREVHQQAGETPFFSQEMEAVKEGTIITEVTNQSSLVEGSAQTQVEGLPALITDSSTIITATYTKATTPSYAYEFSYYQDGQYVESDDKEQWSWDNLLVTPETQRYENYSFDYYTVEGFRYIKEETISLFPNKTTLIAFYYKAKTPLIYPYEIYYELEGISEKGEENLTNQGESILLQPPYYEGYTLEGVFLNGNRVAGDKASLTLDSVNRITYRYAKIEKEEKTNYSYTLEYYLDDFKVEERITLGSSSDQLEFIPEANRYEGYQYMRYIYRDQQFWTATVLHLSSEASENIIEIYYRIEAVDPEKPDPEKPDPEKPDPEKPDPEKPDPEKPDPEKPDPEKPDPEKPDPEYPNPQGQVSVQVFAGVSGKPFSASSWQEQLPTQDWLNLWPLYETLNIQGTIYYLGQLRVREYSKEGGLAATFSSGLGGKTLVDEYNLGQFEYIVLFSDRDYEIQLTYNEFNYLSLKEEEDAKKAKAKKTTAQKVDEGAKVVPITSVASELGSVSEKENEKISSLSLPKTGAGEGWTSLFMLLLGAWLILGLVYLLGNKEEEKQTK